jgi:Holliday junction resolvase
MEPKKKRIHSKKKGSKYELDLVKKFKELGFECTTSRLSSRELDNLKVDIFGLPFNVQAKAVEATKCLHTVLESMPDDEKMNFVFHKKNRRSPLVAMHEKDFMQLLIWAIDAGHIQKDLTSKF